MTIQFRCDCGRQLKVKDELAGRRVKCPECSEVLTVPEEGGEAIQAARPAERAKPQRRPRDEDELDEDEQEDEEDRPRRKRGEAIQASRPAERGKPRRRPRDEEEMDEDEDEYEDEEERPRRRRRPAVRGSGRSRQNLYTIAVYQKVILVCILCYLGAVVFQFFIPPALRLVLGLMAVLVILTAAVFVFLLATQVYSVGLGILLGILTLVPFVGFIMLLIINGKATAVLKEHGYAVGLLGASLSEFS